MFSCLPLHRPNQTRCVVYSLIPRRAMPALMLAAAVVLITFPARAGVDLDEVTSIDADIAPLSGPDVSANSNGNAVIVWTTLSGGEAGPDGDVFAIRSTDAGASWSDPIAVTEDPGAETDVEQDATVALGPDGTAVAVWSIFEDDDADLLFSRSTDAGATWTEPEFLNTGAATDDGNDRLPSIATDGDGRWIVAWQSDEDAILLGLSERAGLIDPGTDDDILYAISDDDGVTWSEPQVLNSTAFTDEDREDTRPRVATDRDGVWIVAWEIVLDALGGGDAVDETDIAFARSTDNGDTFSDVEILNGNAIGDDSDDEDVSIDTDRNGNWVAVWRTEDGIEPQEIDILASRSTDNGDSWNGPVIVNEDDTDDQEEFGPPVVVSNGGDLWVALYSAFIIDNDIFSGDAGAAPRGLFPVVDPDSFISCSTDAGETWTDAEEASDEVLPDAALDGAGRIIAAFEDDEELDFEGDIFISIGETDLTGDLPNATHPLWGFYD